MTSAHRPSPRPPLAVVRRVVAPTVIASAVAVIAVLLVAATGAGQLPPEVLADSHLLQVEQALRDGDHSGASASVLEVLRLQRDHDLDLPEFHYWYARVADVMDFPEQALESVTQYLTAAGREARHYVDALALMNTLQATVLCNGWNTEAYFETATLEQTMACLENRTRQPRQCKCFRMGLLCTPQPLKRATRLSLRPC